MTIKKYTYVYNDGNVLHVRGIDENGKRVTNFNVDFEPIVWTPLEFSLHQWRDTIVEQETTNWKTLIGGKRMNGVRFKNIESCRKFLNVTKTFEFDDSGNRNVKTEVHTAPSNEFSNQYITTVFKDKLHIDMDELKIYSYDIETEVGHRDVSDDTEVTIRTYRDEHSIEHQDVVTDKMTIAKFEMIPDRDKWELFNPEDGTWVRYDDHPYRYIGGFPDPLKADEKITLITVKDWKTKQIYTWGLNEFNNTRDDVTYYRFSSETELLKHFVDWWSADYPDIVTSWNGTNFDNTYVPKRITRVLGVEWARRLSPFGVIRYRGVDHNEYGDKTVETNWVGVADLDYLRLYKKYTYGVRESYRLDDVAHDEVGARKIPNPTGGSFKDFYTGRFEVYEKPNEDDHEIKKLGYIRTKMHQYILDNPNDTDTLEKYRKLDDKIVKMCHQLFTEYNIRDVELIDKIDGVQRLIEQITAVAYMSHCNYEDVFAQTKTWDCMLYHYAHHNGLVIPIKKGAVKTEKFMGAYCKPPLVGKHEYCVSFDLDSLYPHLLMEYNISPETMLKDRDGKVIRVNYDLDKLVNKEEDTSFAHEKGISIASSGVCFSKEKQGILPYFCDLLYKERKSNKKHMLKVQNEHEKVVEELRKRGLMK